MKIIFLILFLCINFHTFSQNKDEIFRMQSKTESTVMSTCNVNILKLNYSGDYEIIFQEYTSKIMMKKNIIYHIEKEYGKWKRKGDTIILDNEKNKKKTLFYIKNNNNIALIIEGVEVSNVNWKKIKNK